MQISPVTINILKNFQTINSGIIIKQGSSLKTMSVRKNIFANATIPDVFEKEFAIYDLSEFLSTLSLFSNPDLQFKEDHVLIESDRQRVKYFYSSPAVIVAPPEKDITAPNAEIKFVLTSSELEQVLKASSVMKLKSIAINNQGICAMNRVSGGNLLQLEVDFEKKPEKSFEHIIQVENLKMVPADYIVEVSEKGIAKFSSSSITYYLALEAE